MEESNCPEKEVKKIVSLFEFHGKTWRCIHPPEHTVKILKIGTPEIITIIVLQLEQLDFTVQYCVPKDADRITNREDPDQTAP